MYINEQNFATNFDAYYKLRDFMIHQIYNNMDNINTIINLISSKIDCLDINYDATRFTICISIKKTTMRKAKGYNASSIYYYGVMNSVFSDFFNSNPYIIAAASNWVGSPIHGMKFENICQVYCIGDKAVEIRL